MTSPSRLGSFVERQLIFFREALRATREIGALSATTRAVAAAVAEPIVHGAGPLRVLEAGAGTGALTRAILERLRPRDRLDIYEVNPAFARWLRDGLPAAPGVLVRVFERDVLELAGPSRYDAIVSSLPLLNFAPEKVKRLFDLYLDRLEPDGTLSYLDYWAKEVRLLIGRQSERRRVRAVLEVSRAFLDRHEFGRRVVLWNVPPACVHYLRKVKRPP